jgi:hypothetical protein
MKMAMGGEGGAQKEERKRKRGGYRVRHELDADGDTLGLLGCCVYSLNTDDRFFILAYILTRPAHIRTRILTLLTCMHRQPDSQTEVQIDLLGRQPRAQPRLQAAQVQQRHDIRHHAPPIRIGPTRRQTQSGRELERLPNLKQARGAIVGDVTLSRCAG